MIANFQTHAVAERYRMHLWQSGYLFALITPYRGGWQVFTTGLRYEHWPWGIFT